MKQKYVIPQIKVFSIENEQVILAGSAVVEMSSEDVNYDMDAL